MKRSFTLLEVLISLILFSTALTFLIPPLSGAGKAMREQSVHIAMQTIADEEMNKLYAQLFQKAALKPEQFKLLFDHKDEGSYTLDCTIQEVETKRVDPSYVGFFLQLTAQDKTFPKARAERYFYICAKIN